MTASGPVTPELPAVLQDVTRNRQRQIEKGYTPEHDDRHALWELGDLADSRMHQAANYAESPEEQRQLVLDAATILVAAVEMLDRTGGRL